MKVETCAKGEVVVGAAVEVAGVGVAVEVARVGAAVEVAGVGAAEERAVPVGALVGVADPEPFGWVVGATNCILSEIITTHTHSLGGEGGRGGGGG